MRFVGHDVDGERMEIMELSGNLADTLRNLVFHVLIFLPWV